MKVRRSCLLSCIFRSSPRPKCAGFFTATSASSCWLRGQLPGYIAVVKHWVELECVFGYYVTTGNLNAFIGPTHERRRR